MNGAGQGKVAPGPILALALESLRRIARNFEVFLRLALVPAIASFLLEVLMFNTDVAELFNPISPREPTAGDMMVLLPILVLNFLPVSLFAVAWTRVVLLQPAAEPGLLLRWGPRELAYFVRLVALVASVAVVVMLPTLFFGGAAGGVVTMVAVIVSLLMVARAMLVLPAAALGTPFGFSDAIAATRGATPVWILLAMAIVYLPFLPFFLLIAGLLQATGLALAAPYASLFIQVAIGYGMQAGAVGLQALLFRHLTGWRPIAPASVSA